MTTINIKLTIGNETREVEAYVAKRYDHEDVITWASVTTTHGNRTHVGSLTFKRNEADEYNLRDCRDITYHGMRGNGHARRSQFRHIGFLPVEQPVLKLSGRMVEIKPESSLHFMPGV